MYSYNVDFEMMAAVVLLVLHIYLHLMFPKNVLHFRRFSNFVLLLLIATVLDIVCFSCIRNKADLPVAFNLMLSTVYFIVSATAEYSFFRFINSYLDNHESTGRRINRLVCQAVLVLVIVLFVVNIRQGFVFSFGPNSEYIRGPYAVFEYFAAVFYLTNSTIMVIIHHKEFSLKQSVSFYIFSGIMLGCFFISNYVFLDLPLGYVGATIAALVMFFSLENPDQQKLEKAMQELEAEKEKAQSANRAKDAFLANMGHEIRTPINAIMGFNEMILRESKDPDTLEHARNIENTANGLLVSVSNILDVSRIESGKVQIVEAEYNFSKLLCDCYNALAMQAIDKHLELLIENDPNIPRFLYGDEVRIRQVLLNLLSNAVKYTKEGRIRLSVTEDRWDLNHVFLRIVVEDTGIGIAQEDHDRIFEAFTRIDSDINSQTRGTGIGLMLTKEIVKNMNGFISVKSDVGKGATFTVELSQGIVLGKTEKMGNFWDYYVNQQEDETICAADFSAPDVRILMVDDVPMNCKVVSRILEPTHMLVDCVNSGQEALEKVKNRYYDLIILDYLMPSMDGITTIKNMRRLGNYPCKDTPIIALTSNVLFGARDSYRDAGFEDYLLKPIQEKDLCRTLVSYLPPKMLFWKEKEATVKPFVAIRGVLAEEEDEL